MTYTVLSGSDTLAEFDTELKAVRYALKLSRTTAAKIIINVTDNGEVIETLTILKET
jgi:hypothetical protein